MTDAEVDAIEKALSTEDREMLDELADLIARLRMVSPALFFFESIAPMGTAGSAVMTMLSPFVRVIVTGTIWDQRGRWQARWDAMSRILDRRGSIELMVRRLEARA